jgi:hypothetical protein
MHKKKSADIQSIVYLRRYSVRLGFSSFLKTARCSITVTWIDQNSSGNAEVHAVVLVNQSSDILPGASPEGHVAFHVISTVMQQASQGRCMCQISAVAHRMSCCSQHVGTAHATTSVSASRRPLARWRHAGVHAVDDRIQRRSSCRPITTLTQSRFRIEPDGHEVCLNPRRRRANRNHHSQRAQQPPSLPTKPDPPSPPQNRPPTCKASTSPADNKILHTQPSAPSTAPLPQISISGNQHPRSSPDLAAGHPATSKQHSHGLTPAPGWAQPSKTTWSLNQSLDRSRSCRQSVGGRR